MSQTIIPGKMVKIKTSGGIYPSMEVEVFRPPYKPPKNAGVNGMPIQVPVANQQQPSDTAVTK
ncbi:MAG: hypothetical protein ACRC46_01685 [Thermoguttaceae bacterium]